MGFINEKSYYLGIIFLIVFTGKIQSQDIKKPEFADEKIDIDGVLSENVWKKAAKYSGFKSYRPDFGKTIDDSTFVSIAYDKENLYVAFRCIDSEPGRIRATLAARDQIIGDDWVCINLDSRNERQGINSFVVNPNGVQYDSFSSATSEDASVDLVWYSAGKINKDGYCIEMKIPFKSIRYGNKDTVLMGALFERRISRKSIHITFPALDPSLGNSYLTQLIKMEFNNIKHYNLFEFLPSATYS